MIDGKLPAEEVVPTIQNGVSNTGGGLKNYDTLTLTGCTLTGNSASDSGGGIYNNPYGTLTLTDDILYGDTAPAGSEIVGIVTASHCDIQQAGYAGSSGNLNANSAPVRAGVLRRSHPDLRPAPPASARASPSAASPPTSAASPSLRTGATTSAPSRARASKSMPPAAAARARQSARPSPGD